MSNNEHETLYKHTRTFRFAIISNYFRLNIFPVTLHFAHILDLGLVRNRPKHSPNEKRVSN